MGAIAESWVTETWHVGVTLVLLLTGLGAVWKFLVEPVTERRLALESRIRDLERQIIQITQRLDDADAERRR